MRECAVSPPRQVWTTLRFQGASLLARKVLMRGRTSFFYLAAAIFAFFLFAGCASKISQQLPSMVTLAEAEAAFGPPQSSTEKSDGTVVHEWGFDETEFVPGQYVTQRVYMGHDRDGFRKYYEREVWVPAHRSGRYCHIMLVLRS